MEKALESYKSLIILYLQKYINKNLDIDKNNDINKENSN